MSAPARKLQEPPARRTAPRKAPARPKTGHNADPARSKPASKPASKTASKTAPTTSTRSGPSVRTTAARPRPTSPPQPRVRARRGFHLAFWVFSAAVISSIVVGVVALNAMVVNTTYRIEDARQTLDDLQVQQGSLNKEVATLSAPSTIAEWAAARGMVDPRDVVILPVAGVGADR